MPTFSEFQRDGYVMVRGAAAPERVAAVVREAQRHQEWAPEQDGWSQYWSETKTAKALLEGQLRELVRSAYAGELAPIDKVQIARVRKCPGRKLTSHVDGAGDPKQGHVDHYGLMVGVFLTDLPTPDMGNFTIWPGSHHETQHTFRGKHGRELVREIWKPRDDEPGDQVKARKGDAIITHHLLRHGTARNLTGSIRYMAFFRCLPQGWVSRFGSNTQRDKSYVEDIWQFSRGWAR